MLKKDFTTKEDLMTILKILNDSNIKYWLDGGWVADSEFSLKSPIAALIFG